MLNANRFYTYAYLREDRTTYYIGKGTARRAYTKHNNIPLPSKNRILILKNNLLEEDAFKHEIYMIAIFGRKDLGTGILRNRTNGGDNPPRFIRHTEESKQKIRNTNKGRVLGPGISEDGKNRLSKRNKEKGICPPLNVKEFCFTSPEGIVYSGENISKFAKEHNLNPAGFISLRTYKQYSYKGWTLTNSCKIRNKKPVKDWNRDGFGVEYCLKSPDGVYYYVIVGELSIFANKYNLLPNGVSRLINGKRKTYRGWELVK